MNDFIKFVTGSIRRIVIICLMIGAVTMLTLIALVSIISNVFS